MSLNMKAYKYHTLYHFLKYATKIPILMRVKTSVIALFIWSSKIDKLISKTIPFIDMPNE